MADTRYPLVSWRFLRAYLVTMRPYLLFVSGAAGAVGLSFIQRPALARVGPAFIALFFSYGLGQALTDCFQTDTDTISAPYRPLVRGVVSRMQVLWVSLAGLTVVILVLAALSPRILILGALAVVGLLTYTYFKRRWWGGPPWNAWIVALIPIMGRLVDRGVSARDLVRLDRPHSIAFALSVLAVFSGYVNFVVMGYFKDISADRETGYNTFPVAFGWRANAVYGDVTGLLAAGLTAWVVTLLGGGLAGYALLAAAAALQVHAQLGVHLTCDEHAVGTYIAGGVRALILYCIAIVVTAQPAWIGPAGLFYMMFELVLRLRPESAQV
jgi:4-hydroxybenzoate polyprenyltransferase